MRIRRLRMLMMVAPALVFLLQLFVSRPAAAETSEVRFAQLYGLTYLPAYVVYEEKLIEKHAARLGIPAPKVTTSKLSSGPAATDALLSGNVDLAMGGFTVLMTLWDKTQSTLKVRGVVALCESPIYLMTVDPRIKSLKDFTEKDRIAVTAVKVTMQALFLNMAAVREWGWDERFKLDPLAINMPHPTAVAALRSGQLEVKNYAATLPYNYEVLAGNNARQLMTSYDVMGGPHTVAAIWASETWAKANPKTYEATVAAFDEAVEMIGADREKAARTYAKWEGSTLPIPDIVRMISNPADISFSTTPSRSLVIAETMQKLGLIKTKPSAWTDYFHAGLHGKKGS